MGSGIVIADAGPLIGLARLQKLTLFKDLFGEVLITHIVHGELFPATDHNDQPQIVEALNEGWLKIVDVDVGEWKPFSAGVDAGEGSAIFLACELASALLIIDDRSGRSEAKAHKLKFMGTAAVVGLAKLKGLIPLAAPVLYDLQASGYRLSNTVIETVLADVGE
uniref:Predicted nucleic acid-binding protein, contains PIN domain n=1 Tax=uncultured Thiotrichaceae bacterium TaxID=298394 RepID=A0A6S6SED1_9GAMM|nr:MAG: Predicted nucleic acid-binding protein, contains PIN domain [uncultured Thiotrichaceae bacterium]